MWGVAGGGGYFWVIQGSTYIGWDFRDDCAFFPSLSWLPIPAALIFLFLYTLYIIEYSITRLSNKADWTKLNLQTVKLKVFMVVIKVLFFGGNTVCIVMYISVLDSFRQIYTSFLDVSSSLQTELHPSSFPRQT